MTMGISTVIIGLLPTYATIGVVGTAAACPLPFVRASASAANGRAAVLLATENAPEGKRRW